MNWYLNVLKKYATFSGRARRKEFWFYSLFNFIFLAILLVIDISIDTFDDQIGLGLLSFLYSLAVIIPTYAVGFRRLQDIGKSGWWILLSFVPLVGPIVVAIFCCKDSQPGDNEYGPNPKQVA